MTTPAPCNACGCPPEYRIAPQPIAGVTLEHVQNQCDARTIVVAQSGAEDERSALARRWNAIMVAK
jgi:hypothetical protein